MRRAVLLLFLAFPAFADRSLYWDEVRVAARLDDDGKLHVRETQSYVFTGDWNGGERTFRVGKGQTLNLLGMKRGDVPMTDGSLNAVDEYSLSDNRLRWRSRLPSDPPFSNTPITYVIEYTIDGVLEKRGDLYNLSHDFAFPDRSGEIKRFILDLDLGSSWRAPDPPTHREVSPLPPGKSLVVDVDLQYTGANAPDARVSTMPIRVALAALIVIAPVLMWARLRKREESLGRFAPLETRAITPSWIESNLLPLPPEVAGTAWDETTSSNEVSALLARWAGERKISAKAEGDKQLVMKLLVPRETFEGYERELIDKMFFSGDETSTSAIRVHYKNSGFSPTTIISRHLQEKADALAAMKDPAPPVSKLPSVILFFTAVALIARSATSEQNGVLVFMGVAIFFTWLVGMGIAFSWRGRIDYGLRQARGFQIVIAIIVGLVTFGLLRNLADWTGLLGLVAAALFTSNSIINIAKSKKGPAAIAFRKRLAAVRQYFIDELQKPEPAIADEWFPYVIAFGLDDKAAAWSSDIASRTTSSHSHFRSSSSSSSSSSSPTWTGGGGAFGGAGASGTWVAAAGGVAAGVASSSSSSSGGGGGGGRSGGGGGGGW